MKLSEGALEQGTLAEVDGEAGAGDFGGAVEVEDAECLADLPVGAGGEGEGGGCAPGADDDVVVLGGTYGDGGLRHVGQRLHELAEAVLRSIGVALESFGVGFEKAHLLGEGGGVGAGFAKDLRSRWRGGCGRR